MKLTVFFGRFLLTCFLLSSCSTTKQLKSYKNSEFAKITEAKLGAGDIVEIRVFGEADLSSKHQISSLGLVNLPLVGPVKIEGLSVEGAASKIKEEYEKTFLKKAEVSLHVAEFKARKIYLLGEVNSPGPYPYEENMTLIAAIALAGGTSEVASPNSTIVTRENPEGQVRFTAKVGDIGRGKSPDVRIFPGDIVFVPESIF